MASPSLRELGGVFLRLGLLGFGGPVAVMAMMEELAVRKKNWLTPEQFGEVYALCKMLPGPVATQMAIYLGSLRGGTRGGIVAGVSFIAPCFVLVMIFSAIYAESGLVSGAGSVLTGLQAAALSIILFSTWQLGRPYARLIEAWVIVVIASVAVFYLPSYEPLVILGFGAIGALRGRATAAKGLSILAAGVSVLTVGLSRIAQAAINVAANADPQTLFQLFWMCCKAGFLVFGTGLAVVPVLEGDAVGYFHWLTHSQFMDGLALGQITPGPVVITATFIGYLAASWPGALAATFGMFLPSFLNVLVILPRIWKKISGSPGARGFSRFAIPAVVGGILGTTLRLSMMTLTQWQPLAVFAGSFLATLVFSPPAWVLLPLAGLVSALLG